MAKAWLFMGALALVACTGPQSRLDLFRLVRDPSMISVFGLTLAMPTEETIRATGPLDEEQATGGAGFDDGAGVVYFSNQQGVLAAVRVVDRQVLWRHQYEEPLTMAPFFVKRDVSHAPHDIVISATQNGRVFAVVAASGEMVWSYELGGEVRRLPTLASGRLLVANSRNQVAALDPASGKWLWQYSREAPQQMTILGHSGVAALGGLAFFGFSDGSVHAVRLEDGGLAWSRPLSIVSGQGFSDADATPQIIGGRLFVASFQDGVFALKPDTGDVLWQLHVDGVTRLAGHDPYLFAASASGELLGIEAESGRAVWKFRFPVADVTNPVPYRGYVAIGARPGGLYVLDESSGRLVQRFHPGGVEGDLTEHKGNLAFLSENSFLYVLRYGQTTGPIAKMPERFVGL